MKVEEILAALGVAIDPAKAATIQEWNGKLSASENDAQTRLATAQSEMQKAQGLQRVIDDNIRAAGLTETNVAQLQANNAALTAANASLTAAVEEVRKQGFTGITIPALPTITQPTTPDPMKAFQESVVKGFATMGQTLNESNRYQRVFGVPLPEDPATIADRAAQARLSVHDYMEQTYKVSAKEQEIAAAGRQKELDTYAAKQVEAYKAANPVTAGNPDLNGGGSSFYPNLPKPRDAKSIREFSSLSPMQKIQDAKARVTKEVQSRMNAA